MHQVRITNTVYDSGAAKYLAGQLYPVTEDTLRQVALRNGEEVDEPTEDELAAAAAAQAEAEANERAAAEEQAAAAAQQAAASTDAPPAAAPAPAPAPAAPTPVRKRAG